DSARSEIQRGSNQQCYVNLIATNRAVTFTSTTYRAQAGARNRVHRRTPQPAHRIKRLASFMVLVGNPGADPKQVDWVSLGGAVAAYREAVSAVIQLLW